MDHPVLILGYALSCTTLRVVGITTRSVVQLSLPSQAFGLDDALVICDSNRNSWLQQSTNLGYRIRTTRSANICLAAKLGMYPRVP